MRYTDKFFQKETFGPINSPTWLKRALALLLILSLALLLGGWRQVTGRTIDPKHVARIENGKTTLHQIKAWFGDPKEVERTPEGKVFKYYSFKDAPPVIKSKLEREVDEQSSSPFFVDEDKKVKRVPLKKEGKILQSTLTIRFKPDGETVMSHEYKEH